jgi:hypothetical protein
MSLVKFPNLIYQHIILLACAAGWIAAYTLTAHWILTGPAAHGYAAFLTLFFFTLKLRPSLEKLKQEFWRPFVSYTGVTLPFLAAAHLLFTPRQSLVDVFLLGFAPIVVSYIYERSFNSNFMKLRTLMQVLTRSPSEDTFDRTLEEMFFIACHTHGVPSFKIRMELQDYTGHIKFKHQNDPSPLFPNQRVVTDDLERKISQLTTGKVWPQKWTESQRFVDVFTIHLNGHLDENIQCDPSLYTVRRISPKGHALFSLLKKYA